MIGAGCFGLLDPDLDLGSESPTHAADETDHEMGQTLAMTAVVKPDFGRRHLLITKLRRVEVREYRA